MDARTRHHVVESGRADGRPMLFVHGFGCDQNMWRHVAPRFESDHRVILMDLVGAGDSKAVYDPVRYASLQGYADDLVEVMRELDLHDVALVGHSVSAMIGALAEIQEPQRFGALVMVAPSPRYIDDPATGYVGGFAEADIDELLDSLASNYLGWSSAMAPVIVGNPERPELGQELTSSFCRMDPEIARGFATTTFRSDSRADLSRITAPVLVLQCQHDVIAPVAVGEYVAAAVPDATLVMLDATGHCPNLSAPEQTYEAISSFVSR